MLIKITICDDDARAVARHENIVKDCLKACSIGYEITAYTSGKNEAEHIREVLWDESHDEGLC